VKAPSKPLAQPNAPAAPAYQNLANLVLLSPLPEVPGARFVAGFPGKLMYQRWYMLFCLFRALPAVAHRVKKYLGPILLHFLKDSFAVRGPASKQALY
jgi:hypothetical protein